MEYKLERNPNYGLSANTLKIIAVIAMLTDHIAWAFIPTLSIPGQAMHLIGRLTAPIMCYFIAEGYHHTRNVKKYATRLGVFALISHFPVIYFETGRLPVYYSNGIHFYFKLQTGVVYTLLLGLLSLMVWNNQKLKGYMKKLLIALLVIASIPGDWQIIGVLWILIFGIYHGDIKKQMIGFSIVSAILVIGSLFYCITNASWRQVFQMGIYLAIPLLIRYNKKLGYNANHKWIKWSFYIFYPLHLFIIAIIKFAS